MQQRRRSDFRGQRAGPIAYVVARGLARSGKSRKNRLDRRKTWLGVVQANGYRGLHSEVQGNSMSRPRTNACSSSVSSGSQTSRPARCSSVSPAPRSRITVGDLNDIWTEEFHRPVHAQFVGLVARDFEFRGTFTARLIPERGRHFLSGVVARYRCLGHASPLKNFATT